MNIATQLIPTAPSPNLLVDRAVVVIDVLRATSVIIHAFSQGALEIIPVVTIEDGYKISKAFPPGFILLGGESESKKIPGFDLGNSPREYTAERVKGKKVILKTTNGTKAFHLVSSGKEILVGSFFNIGSVARRCVELDRDLLIFPSGDEGNLSLEDAICGGMLIELITRKEKKHISLTDASVCAKILYKEFEDNLLESFHLSHHGRELIERGYEEDLAYCCKVDSIPLVPVYRDGVIRI